MENKNTKVCSRCKISKPKSEFYSRKSAKDGLRSHCIKCHQKYHQSRKNKKQHYDKERYKNNKEVVDQRSINYYHNNKEKKQSYDKKIRQKVLLKSRIRYSKDLDYKLKCNLRSRLYQTLRKNKKSSTIEFLGCSIQELKFHLESQFTEGMNWDNYGDWHIDHIRPCCSFDLTDPEQQKQCFHYTNLQPLWARDNFKKSKKWNK